ncbi:methionine--tRNA ligase subunit beta [Candidatus Micrarchaeota archaeon CG1_02_55_22]|nr:MAG: methionine--tRNA ligase subunit beta [Candidatus Micrarchaeota archaeon CG1_02_55_22]
MDTIAFEDFAKIKLRVAKILECEPVEGSDKLYKLSIRIGEETRTLAAGLAKHYAPDELLGKKIIVVYNLAPRTLKGIESQGMLLAAEDDEGHLGLLSVDNDEVKDGAQVG